MDTIKDKWIKLNGFMHYESTVTGEIWDIMPNPFQTEKQTMIWDSLKDGDLIPSTLNSSPKAGEVRFEMLDFSKV